MSLWIPIGPEPGNEETELNYSLDVILIDALIGMLALALIAGIALFLGGFSFFTPWLIACPVIMFIAGLLRSRSKGAIWLKCVVICLAPLVVSALTAKPLDAGIAIAAALLILPCIGGLWFRRRGSPVNPWWEAVNQKQSG
jgi:hypothetical protein